MQFLRLVAALVSAFFLLLTVAVPGASAATSATDVTVSISGSLVAPPGTAVHPFADAEISGSGSGSGSGSDSGSGSGSGTMDGISIRITQGHNENLDTMKLTSPPAGITVIYSSSKGLLRLRGTASVADYQAALRAVTYEESAATAGSRTFIVVAGRAIYLPLTGNLYEYVPGTIS